MSLKTSQQCYTVLVRTILYNPTFSQQTGSEWILDFSPKFRQNIADDQNQLESSELVLWLPEPLSSLPRVY